MACSAFTPSPGQKPRPGSLTKQGGYTTLAPAYVSWRFGIEQVEHWNGFGGGAGVLRA